MLSKIIRFIKRTFNIVLIVRQFTHKRNHNMKILFGNVIKKNLCLLPFAHFCITSYLE